MTQRQTGMPMPAKTRFDLRERVVGLSGYTLNPTLLEFVKTAKAVVPIRPAPPRRLNRRWDEATRDKAVSLYISGLSARTVAERLGMSKTALQRLLNEKGVMRRQPRLTEQEIDEAILLYDSGLLLREVGERLGVSRDCVRLALKRRGVALRPGLGARQIEPRREPES